MKQNIPRFRFWNVPSVLLAFITQVKIFKKVYGDFCSATDMKIPIWKQRKVVRGAWLLPNGEKVSNLKYIFPLEIKVFVFIFFGSDENKV